LDVFPQLVRSGLRLGRVDLNAAFEMGTVLDADPRRGNIAGDRPVLLMSTPAGWTDLAQHFAGDDHFARVNFGIEAGPWSRRSVHGRAARSGHHVPVNLQIFIASNLPF